MSTSPLENNLSDNTFFTNWSDLKERYDPLFYVAVKNIKESIEARSKYNCEKLIKKCSITRGRFGHRPRNDPRFYGGDYPFIQTGDIVKASEINGSIRYTQTLNELGRNTSKLFNPPQLLFTIAANIGDTAILDFPSCFPDSIVALTPLDDDLSIEYLNFYLKLIKPLVVDLAPYSAQKNLNNQQLAQVPVIIPPKDVQEAIVQRMTAAYSLKINKEEKAKELLNSIDEFLIEELGIQLPNYNEIKLDCTTFTRSFSEVTGNRFDPYFYKPEFLALTNELERSPDCVELKSILKSIYNGFDSREFLDEGTPYLKVANVRPFEIREQGIQYIDSTELPARIKLKEGDVLLTRKGSYGFAKAISKEEEHYVISSEIFRLELSDSSLASYVEIFLNSTLAKTQYEQIKIGAIMGSLTQDVVKKIKIIIPDQTKIETIVQHVNLLREKAKKLIAEGVEELNASKAELVKTILNG